MVKGENKSLARCACGRNAAIARRVFSLEMGFRGLNRGLSDVGCRRAISHITMQFLRKALLAQTGHHDRGELCPLLGVKRT